MPLMEIRELFRQSAENLDQLLNQKVSLRGWIRTVRSSGEIGFIQLHDGTDFRSVQVVFEKGLSNFELVEKFHVGSAVLIEGLVVKSLGDKQPFEIKASRVELLGDSELDYPLQKKGHSLEFLRTISHLRPRTNTFQATFRLRSVLAHAIHTFFQDRGFVYVHAPIITASDCEGAGEMFRVTTLQGEINTPLSSSGLPRGSSLDSPIKSENDKNKDPFSEDFFGKKSGLTVSGQLNAECFAMAFSKVYTFGPTFRAENSNTARHAAEFWMIEPEVAFADLLKNRELAESMMKFLFQTALEKCPQEMAFFDQFIEKGVIERLESILKSEFGHLSYTEAVKILENSGESFQFPVSWGIDLQSEHEQWLCKHLGKPVFVTDYPKDIKAFYMRMNEDEKTVAAMDLLVPGVGEIIGGSQREERLDRLDDRMKGVGIDPASLWWYRDLRRYGGVAHAGFGMGFERLVQYVSGMHNIRDVIPFPRTPKNCDF